MPGYNISQTHLSVFFEHVQGWRRTKEKSHRTRRARFSRYIFDFWNVCDILSFLLLVAAMLVRHLRTDENETYEDQGGEIYPWQVYPYRTSRRIFPISLFVMYIRFLQCFLMHRVLGPTLIMIKEMVSIHYLSCLRNFWVSNITRYFYFASGTCTM